MVKFDFQEKHRAYINSAEYLSPNEKSLLLGSSIPLAASVELDRIVDALTFRLAEYGFDIEYELTPEGVLIEETLDKIAEHFPCR